jgi:alkanesulfonate monooxygenase SsuD/methylene tetrahydromethanopterin reductase-like flavin-dependent oxidoreductase (luciferase family)
MLGLNVFAADSDDEARRLFSSLQQAFVNLRRGHPGPLPPPVDDFDRQLTPMDRLGIAEMLACSVVGSPETVQRGIAQFVAATGADELMITSQIFDHTARLRSYEITAEVRDRLGRD